MLRSVSPIHIEYLKNMGVGASLSISIIVDGKLWGLFACHHYCAALPELRAPLGRANCSPRCSRCGWKAASGSETVEYERRARDISDQLLGAVASDETLLKDPDWLGDILTNAIPADGVGVWINGNYAFSGVDAADRAISAAIVRALNGTAAGKVFATDHIASLVPGAEAFAADAAGMLAIPISRIAARLCRAVPHGADPLGALGAAIRTSRSNTAPTARA